ncbi:GTP cyclohydrolase I [Puerhibacterium puerhi]|uniref:GTP cyclohydrolase I n=1 Tax=Puerhibacterium puerhi TaxID=2692623 RepID=UPI00135BB38D|nr:GTP cyclohydrolase I [Puerhibacterium puerhi]
MTDVATTAPPGSALRGAPGGLPDDPLDVEVAPEAPGGLEVGGGVGVGVAAWRPRIVHDRPPVDGSRAERAAAELLAALGQPLDDAGLRDTPRRMAQAWAELLAAPELELTTFPNDDGYAELVVLQNIPVRSVCEHHMLPFVGVAHVGYLPGLRIAGLSKLARVVDHFARRAQTQERLTLQVAEELERRLGARGVGVVVEAEHTCLSLRGARAGGTRTVTSALTGALRDDAARRAEFLALARGRGAGR